MINWRTLWPFGRRAAAQSVTDEPRLTNAAGLSLAGVLSDQTSVYSNKPVRGVTPKRVTFTDGCYVEAGGSMKLCGRGRVDLTYANGGTVKLENSKVSGNSRIIIR